MGQSIFRGWGLAEVKEEPPAAGTGARRRGTPLSILGFRVVSGRGGDAGAGGSAGGGWQLRGVQVEDELQALHSNIQIPQ